jgi:hypothetical protein
MKKLIAGFMTALMTLITVVNPVMAANVGDYPTFLEGDDGALEALVVIGAAAKVGDVVGAIDLASRLAEVGETTVSHSCPGVSGAVTGTRKETVPLNGDLSTVFPASGVLKTAHYSGLLDTKLSWRGTDYDYREQVNFGSVGMSHDLATSMVNGTEKMVIESGDIKYQLVFEKALAGTGSVAVPNYTYPVYINMLGKQFAIVGAASGQLKMLHGSIGTATATTPVVYEDYSIYADLGSGTSGSAWARVIIEDADGNIVEQMTVSQGDSKQSTATGLTVQVNTVRALMDGTIVGADLVVGPTAEGVTKTYDNTADVTSTGTASDRFPGETDWGIQTGTNVITSAASFSAGAIAAGDVIEVIYKPSTTQYLLAGEKVSLPNEYGDLEYEGWNTDKFATVTIAPLGGTLSAYNYSADTQAFGNLGGFEISTDVAGTIVSTANTGFDKAYFLFNYSRTALQVPIFIGFYDSSKQKIIVNGSILAAGSSATTSEYLSKIIDLADAAAGGNGTVSYAFKLIYGNAGDQTYYLNMTAAVNSLAPRNMLASFAGKSASTASLSFQFFNKTAVSTSQAPSFQLGGTSATAEVYEVNATTHGTTRNAGKRSQEIVDDSGVLLQDSSTYGASDKIVFKVPFKALNATVYFGKKGEGVSGDTVECASYPSIPITSALARLDSELTAADKAKNLIAVGGPAVNMVSAAALELDYPTGGQTAADAIGISEGEGAVSVIDSPYADDKVVVLVAGWDVDNTRAACSAVQLFDTKLAGIAASSVVVTGSVGAPVVTEVA